MSERSFSAVLRLPNFFRLWMGQIISSVGDRFYQFALLNVVLAGTEIGKEVARITFFGLLPGLLLAPLFGWVVDRFERRAVMIFTDVVRALMALSLIYFGYLALNLPAIFAIIFCMGAMNGLFIPARQAAVPQIVPGPQLVTANALIATVGIIASMIASVVAVLLITIFGQLSSFVITALGFLASAWVVWRINVQLRPGPEALRGMSGGGTLAERVRRFWRELTVGLRVVRDHGEFLGIIVVKSLLAFTSGMFLVVVLEHTAQNVDLTLAEQAADGLVALLTPIAETMALKPPVIDDVRLLSAGMVFGVIGVGLGLGVWFCGKSKRWSHWRALPFVGLLLLGLGTLLYAFLPTIGWAMVVCLPLGFFSSIISIPIDARLQHDTTDDERGRVFAVANLCTTTALLVALVINLDGSLLRIYGPTDMVIALGAGLAIISLLLMLFYRKQIRGYWDSSVPPVKEIVEHLGDDPKP